MYIILKNKKDIYFFNKISKKYNIEELYFLNTDKPLFKLLKKVKISILGKWKNEINKYDKFIIFESLYNEKVAKKIKRTKKENKVIVYFWNYIDDNNKYILNDKNIDEFWTFDKNDAKKYNMKYNPQFYTKNVKIQDEQNKYDVLFLGRPKTRKKDIVDLEKKLKEEGIQTNFKIIENEKDYVSYDEYLKMIAESKCILDYNQEGQVGLSLRPMEALFLERKLITNNTDIKNYDFYNHDNIFILGEDNINEIKEFINKPYKKIDQDIIDYYDFDQWLNRFGV
jgi:hypothetical protein